MARDYFPSMSSTWTPDSKPKIFLDMIENPLRYFNLKLQCQTFKYYLGLKIDSQVGLMSDLQIYV